MADFASKRFQKDNKKKTNTKHCPSSEGRTDQAGDRYTGTTAGENPIKASLKG